MSLSPFGAPDAASNELNLDEQFEAFLNVDGTITKEHDSAIPRVVFGRKGAGKSHYLRALNALKLRDHSVLAFGPSTDPPPHDAVIRLSLDWGPAAIPQWQQLWQKAILISTAATLVYYGSQRESAMSSVLVDDLRRLTRVALGGVIPSGPVTPFQAIRFILAHSGTAAKIQDNFGRQVWQQLESSLEPLLAGSPPIYFFLDNLDAVEAFAPRPWQSCQRGLLGAVLAFAEDRRWNRIHVVVALKDTVVQALFDGFQGHRYVHSPMLHRLDWHTTQSQQFLRWKIDLLADRWFTGEHGNPTERWLACGSVHNDARNCNEEIEAYLLRHTLLLPRDIVEMGNCLCDEILRARARRRERLDNREIRGAVRRAAKQIGKTGVIGAAIEVARWLMPSDAPLHGSDEAFGVSNEDSYRENEDDMTSAISDQYAVLLRQALIPVEFDRFDHSSLGLLKDRLRTAISREGCDEEAVGALWRLGMVGIIDGDLEFGEARFYGHSEHDGDAFSDGVKFLALHPSMIDYLGVITAVGDPVYPEPGFVAALSAR